MKKGDYHGSVCTLPTSGVLLGRWADKKQEEEILFGAESGGKDAYLCPFSDGIFLPVELLLRRTWS